MSFDLTADKHDEAGEMFFDPKPCEASKLLQEEGSFQSNIVVAKDLFESITEAHYLPDLDHHHEEAISANELLDSLVEKGCEDNQIIGNSFEKLAHLVSHNNNIGADYNDEDEDILLDNAPVTDIIHRLEQSLESPSQNSITAAQGLLHLQQMSEDLAKEHLQNSEEGEYHNEFGDGCQASIPTSCIETLISNNNGEVNDNNHLSAESVENEGNDTIESDKSEEDLREEAINEEYSKDEEILCKSNDNDNVVETANEDTTERAEMAPLTENESTAYTEDETGQSNEDERTSDDDNNSGDQQGYQSCDPDLECEKETLLTESGDELIPTDLSVKHSEKNVVDTTNELTEMTDNTDNMSEKSDDLPKDLSCHKRVISPCVSPKRLETPRPPSRGSDTMQSPQPSGIPAVPPSPELFTVPQAKSNSKSLFLETLLASPSPKMCFSSELTITKHQSEPLNLGKSRKSASPTVTSCSDEIKKMQKDYGEPDEKRIKRETDEVSLIKLNKIFNKSNDSTCELKQKRSAKSPAKLDEPSPLKQLQGLRSSVECNIPDPLLVPKERLNAILAAPAREIPALLLQRPELRLPEAFAYPTILQDPDILVISLSQLETILLKQSHSSEKEASKHKEQKSQKAIPPDTSKCMSSIPNNTIDMPAKQIPSMDALAGDIDAATSAALNQMLWLPYLSQLEAAAMACSQNTDFLKALNTAVPPGYVAQSSFPDLSNVFAPQSRPFLGPAGFPMMPQLDYNNQLELAMWQEAMAQANGANLQRSSKQAATADVSAKEKAELAAYGHSPKNHQSRPHSSARTSPIAHNYTSCQRGAGNTNPFLPSAYPGLNPGVRPNVPLPSLQIPHYNPNAMASQRLARGQQYPQKSPNQHYYHNNNYLQSLKASGRRESRGPPSRPASQSSSAPSPAEEPRPRISVKSLQNLLEPTASVPTSKRGEFTPAYGAASLSELVTKPTGAESKARRRMLGHDEAEVGSTTTTDDSAAAHLHDPQTHLWHPLFGNQKNYSSPWNWTTVTVTGD